MQEEIGKPAEPTAACPRGRKWRRENEIRGRLYPYPYGTFTRRAEEAYQTCVAEASELPV